VHSLKANKQRGVALVEMAMILPFLAMMFVGVVDFGLILREHQILQNAAREGARYSALKTNSFVISSNAVTTAQGIHDIVTGYLQQEKINITGGSCTAVIANQKYTCGSITIDQGTSYVVSGVTSSASKVTVTYTRAPLLGGSLFGNINLNGQAIFRNFY